MQGLALWALPFLPAVGGAAKQSNGSTAWRLEQVVFGEHKPALLVGAHHAGIEQALPPAFICFSQGGSCVNSANGTGENDEAFGRVEPFRLYSDGGAALAEDVSWFFALLRLGYRFKQGVPEA